MSSFYLRIKPDLITREIRNKITFTCCICHNKLHIKLLTENNICKKCDEKKFEKIII